MLGFTIDSLTLFLSWEKLIDFNFQHFEKRINPKTIRRGVFKGWKEGFHKNFRLKFHKNYGIYIMGSISNYSCGYSSLLQYNQLQSSIENLGNELDLELHSARLYRIDLALNIVTNNSITEYNNKLFTDLPHFTRLEQADGVRFDTEKIRIAIYNKTKELSDKRGINIYSNVLRIEFRLLKGVSEVLGVKEMKIENLYNHKNYIKLVNKFVEYYQKIKKQTIPVESINLTEVTPSKFSNLLKRNNLDIIFGSEKDAYRQIEQWDTEGKFKNANNKSRCKKIISDLSNDKIVSTAHPHIEEINQKVTEECEKILREFEVK